MLPRGHRLQKSKDFKRVAAKRQGIRVDGLLLKAATSPTASTRFGIVVSKKVASRAVERNRIRRALRREVQRELASLKEGVDVVLIVLPGFRLGDLQEMRSVLHRLFEKASLFQS